jgi:hypothetical protein
LLSTEQVSLGDVISIDWQGGETSLKFLKEAEGALIPMAAPATERMADAAAASSDGRSIPGVSEMGVAERLPLRPLH